MKNAGEEAVGGGSARDERRMRVLLAEDDDELRDLVGSALRGEGYEVLEASTVAQALQVAGQAEVDLVLTDLGMPNARGDDLLRGLLAVERHPIVVVMTAFPDEATRARAAELGVLLLEKPFSVERLAETLRKATSLPVD